jgi:hypothetical protein
MNKNEVSSLGMCVHVMCVQVESKEDIYNHLNCWWLLKEGALCEAS